MDLVEHHAPVLAVVRIPARIGHASLNLGNPLATEGGMPVGATWLRRFTADAPGYGFVDEDTPEIGIAVVPSFCRRGVGRVLVRQLQHHYPRLSLSVHPENPARQLYASMGFTAVETGDGAMTMLWRRG